MTRKYELMQEEIHYGRRALVDLVYDVYYMPHGTYSQIWTYDAHEGHVLRIDLTLTKVTHRIGELADFQNIIITAHSEFVTTQEWLKALRTAEAVFTNLSWDDDYVVRNNKLPSIIHIGPRSIERVWLPF